MAKSWRSSWAQYTTTVLLVLIMVTVVIVLAMIGPEARKTDNVKDKLEDDGSYMMKAHAAGSTESGIGHAV